MATLPPVQLDKVFAIDNAILPMLSSMEGNGVWIDQDILRAIQVEFRAEMDRYRYELVPHAWSGFSPSSPKQVAELLYGTLNLKRGRKTATGLDATDDDELERLKGQHPAVDLIRGFRKFHKLDGTFVTGILERLKGRNDRLHTNLNHATVVSGRLSSSDPNLQNIPSTGIGKKIRLAFSATDGHVLGVYDESQIELRVLADFSGDKTMIQAYLNGEDLHSKTGHLVGGYPIDAVPKDFRTACKRFNFGMAYGITDSGLKDQLDGEGIHWSVEEVGKFRKEWFRNYPGVPLAMQDVWAYTRKHGRVVDTIGRPRWLPGIWSDIPKIRSEAERQAFNHVIQGGAAAIIKLTMARLWDEMPKKFIDAGVIWILQVHDELIAELPDDDTIKREFEEWVLGVFKTTVNLSIPVFGDGKVAKSWGLAK